MGGKRETRTTTRAHAEADVCRRSRARGRGLVPGDGEVRLVDVMHHARAREHRRECDAVYARQEHARGRVSWWKTGPEIRSRPMRRFVRACEPFFGVEACRGSTVVGRAGAAKMLKRLNLGCADRRQKPGARRPDHSESGVADVEAGGVDMDERQARPQTGRRPLDRISSPPPRDRTLVSFRAPTPHPRLTRPRPSPATVPQASEAAGEPTTRVGRVKLNLRHIMHRHATGTKRARACLFLVPVIMILVMVTRPIYAPLIDVFGPEEQVAGSKRAVGGADDWSAPTTTTGGADDAARGRRALGSAGGAPRRSPAWTNAEHHSKGYRSRDGSREVGGERRRERFGDGSANGSAKRDGERNRSPRAANRASDPRVADKIGLRDGDGVRSFDKDTTSPHHNTSHSLVSPARPGVLEEVGRHALVDAPPHVEVLPRAVRLAGGVLLHAGDARVVRGDEFRALGLARLFEVGPVIDRIFVVGPSGGRERGG